MGFRQSRVDRTAAADPAGRAGRVAGGAVSAARGGGVAGGAVRGPGGSPPRGSHAGDPPRRSAPQPAESPPRAAGAASSAAGCRSLLVAVAAKPRLLFFRCPWAGQLASPAHTAGRSQANKTESRG